MAGYNDEHEKPTGNADASLPPKHANVRSPWVNKIKESLTAGKPLRYRSDELLPPLIKMRNDPTQVYLPEGGDAHIEPELRVLRDMAPHITLPVLYRLINAFGTVPLSVRKGNEPNRAVPHDHLHKGSPPFPTKMRNTTSVVISLKNTVCDGGRELSLDMEEGTHADLEARVEQFCEAVSKVYHIKNLQYRLFIEPAKYHQPNQASCARLILATIPEEKEALDKFVSKVIPKLMAEARRELNSEFNGAPAEYINRAVPLESLGGNRAVPLHPMRALDTYPERKR